MDGFEADGPAPKYIVRSEVTLHPQTNGNVHVELDGKYYRLGCIEGRFINRLSEDGDWEAARDESFGSQSAATTPGNNATTVADPTQATNQLLQFLLQHKIIVKANSQDATQSLPPSTSVANLLGGHSSAAPGATPSPMGMFFYKRISLGDPNALFDGFKHWSNPLFSATSELVKLAIIVFGSIVALNSITRLQSDYFLLFTPMRGLQIFVAWVLLKAAHEFAHGAVCKRYGGDVRDAGIALFMFVPMAFVDVTSAWRFNSRWKRLHVSLAGVATELFLAALAAIAFQYTAAPAVRVFLVDFIALASISSIACNLNPLLKFDGYYALADLSGVDNLQEHSKRYVHYLGQRHLLGLKVPKPSLPPAHRSWIPAFALASTVFRMTLLLGLIAVAAAMFEGLGIIIALFGVYLFCLQPLMKLLRFLRKSYASGELSIPLASLRCGMVFGLPLALLFCLPSNLIETTPGIVQYDPPAVLRAPEDGFIREVLVRSGETVAKGDVILRMENWKLASKLAEKQVELAAAEQAILTARWKLDASEAAAARAEQASLEEQVDELRRRIDALTIHAPVDGQVIARNLQELDGRYFSAGSELVVIGDDSRKRIMLVLDPQQANEIAQLTQPQVDVMIAGISGMKVAIDRIESRASRVVPDESLTALAGGSLAVVSRPGGDPELESPRIRAYASLDPISSTGLHCGQRCHTRLPGSHRTLASVIWHHFSTKIRSLSPV